MTQDQVPPGATKDSTGGPMRRTEVLAVKGAAVFGVPLVTGPNISADLLGLSDSAATPLAAAGTLMVGLAMVYFGNKLDER